MKAETGFELEDSPPPLRISGFICFLLGAASILSVLGQPLLVLPVAAVIVGVFALRRSGGQTPVGTRPAMLGLIMAAAFGSCGFFMPLIKTRILGKQAEQFSKDYLDVVALGHEEFALELNKDYVNRLPTSMSLTEHYAMNDAGMERLQEFRDDTLNAAIRKLGPGAEWVLDRPTRVYTYFGKQKAEVVFVDPTGVVSNKVQIFLEYRIDPGGDGQWNIELMQPYRERIVAEQVL